MEMFNNSTLNDYLYHLNFDDFDFKFDRGKDFIIFEASRFTVGFLTICFNTILVTCFCHEKGLPERSATKRLLFSLSLCDLVTGFSVTVQAACMYWSLIKKMEVIIALDVFSLFLTKAYIMHLCGLTLDRFMSIFCALRYKALVTETTITCYILLTWCFPFVFCIIRIIWLSKNDVEYWYTMVGFVLFLAIPMILLAVAFVKMFCEIRRILKSPPASYYIGAVRTLSKELHVISIFSFMYITFLIVAMPYFTLRFWLDICNWYKIEFTIPHKFKQAVLVMKDVTSLLNPICYTLITPEVRDTFRKSFFRNKHSQTKKLLMKKLDVTTDRSADHSSHVKKGEIDIAEMNV